MPASTSQSALALVHNDDAKQMQIESRTCQACLGNYAEMQLCLSKVCTIHLHALIRFVFSPHWFVNAAFCTFQHPTTVKNTRQILTFLPKLLHNSNKSRTFAATESATLPVRLANQGGSFAFIPMGHGRVMGTGTLTQISGSVYLSP